MLISEVRPNSTSLLICALIGFGVILGVGAWLVMDDATILMEIMYVTIFLALAWRWPWIGLALTFGVAPFQQDLSDGFGPFRFSAAEISLLLCGVAYLFRTFSLKRRIKFSPITIPVVLYLSVCMASSLPEWHTDSMVPAFCQMIVYFFIATIVFSNFETDLPKLLRAFYVLIAVDLFLSFMGLAGGTFYFLGLNKNGVGSSLAMGVIAAMELWLAAKTSRRKNFLFIVITLLFGGLIFSLSRGAWLGTLVGLIVIVVFRRKFKFLLQLCVVLIPLIAICWNLLPAEKKVYATDFDAKRKNIELRLETIEYSKKMFEQSPIYGVGIGLRKEADATNLFWITLAETGIPGLVSFLIIHIVFLTMCYKDQKLIGRNDPIYSLLALGSALVVAKFVHGCVDHYWSRGALMVAWASAGMAIAVHYELKNREAVEIRDRILRESAEAEENVRRRDLMRQLSGANGLTAE